MRSTGWKGAALGCGLTMLLVGAALAQQATDQPSARNMAELKYGPLPGLPTCAQGAIENGDPTAGAFIALAKATSNCTVPWHWHTAAENLMIVDGTVRIEMKGGGEPTVLRAGGFVRLPSRHIHHFRCMETCTFFLYSDAKWDIHYVDPEGKEIPPEQALQPFNETTATAMK